MPEWRNAEDCIKIVKDILRTVLQCVRYVLLEL